MGFIGAPFGIAMYYIQQVIGNYGWTLVVFTILIRLLLFPLNIKQQKSTAKMQAFQPKIKELERKYKNDKRKYQEETMKLYEQEGYNPMSGCLPMVLQLVVLFGIIDVVYKPLNYLLKIPSDVISKATEIIGKTSSAAQLEVINILQGNSQPELYDKLAAVFTPEMLENIQNFNVNFLGMNLGEIPQLGFNLLVLIPILSCATSFLTSFFSMKMQPTTTQGMNGSMKTVMYLMPLMSLWIGFTLPAGVGIYWIISNLATVLQTYILHKIYTPERLAKMNDKSAAKNREKMKNKREKMAEYRKYYLEKTGQKLEPQSDQADKISEDKQEATPEISYKDRIAMAREKLAEQFGDDK